MPKILGPLSGDVVLILIGIDCARRPGSLCEEEVGHVFQHNRRSTWLSHFLEFLQVQGVGRHLREFPYRTEPRVDTQLVVQVSAPRFRLLTLYFRRSRVKAERTPAIDRYRVPPLGTQEIAGVCSTTAEHQYHCQYYARPNPYKKTDPDLCAARDTTRVTEHLKDVHGPRQRLHPIPRLPKNIAAPFLLPLESAKPISESHWLCRIEPIPNWAQHSLNNQRRSARDD